jgi:hypothetical protein
MTPRRLASIAAATLLLAACEIPYDFDGAGGADRVLIDDAGAWRVLGETDPIWTGPAPNVTSGGTRSAAAGDYDGDGTWEPAVVDTATGVWTTAGALGTFTVTPPADPTPDAWSGGVIPAPGDYDGDGDTDPAYFDEATATWHLPTEAPFVHGRPMTDPTAPVVGGVTFHDIAVPADYDGDGDTDPAVYRVETGSLLVRGQGEITGGLPYAYPVPGNYHDGPGDEAATWYLEATGWVVEGETVPRTPFPAGANGLPVPADYDGDGDDDPAITTWQAPERFLVAGQPAADLPSPKWWTAATVRPWVLRNILYVTAIHDACLAGEPSDPGCP